MVGGQDPCGNSLRLLGCEMGQTMVASRQPCRESTGDLLPVRRERMVSLSDDYSLPREGDTVLGRWEPGTPVPSGVSRPQLAVAPAGARQG